MKRSLLKVFHYLHRLRSPKQEFIIKKASKRRKEQSNPNWNSRNKNTTHHKIHMRKITKLWCAIIEELTKWRASPWSDGKTRYCQDSMLPNSSYRLDAIPIKIPPGCLIDVCKQILWQFLGMQMTQNSHTTWKQSKVRGVTPSNFKTYYETMSITDSVGFGQQMVN